MCECVIHTNNMKNLYLEMLKLRSKGGEVDENFQNPKVDSVDTT